MSRKLTLTISPSAMTRLLMLAYFGNNLIPVSPPRR